MTRKALLEIVDGRDSKALRLTHLLKNLDIGDLHAAVTLVAKGTRWFASVNTQYNPVFGVINFARDAQSGLLNLSTTALAGREREVASGVFPALRAIYRQERGKQAANPANRQWIDLWKQLQEAGGSTGYRDLYANIEDRTRELEKELGRLDRGAAGKTIHYILDWLSDYNEAMENAVRVSAFKVALDQGMSTERAASLAKNLTVNFNRKGRQTREIGAFYAFFNAAIQGTVRMWETLRGPMGRKIMLGGVLLGAVNALIGMAVMGGDDDGDDHWDKIPEFVKERSLIVPLGRADYLSIPLPLGFHFLPNVGRLAVEFMLGGPDKTAGRQVGRLLQVVLDAFNPLGGSQTFSQMVTPTVADPAVALWQNRDWTGRPIYRETMNPLDPQPGTAMAKDSATPWAKAASELTNWITGGTKYQPGMWSPTPDQIDYVFGQTAHRRHRPRDRQALTDRDGPLHRRRTAPAQDPAAGPAVRQHPRHLGPGRRLLRERQAPEPDRERASGQGEEPRGRGGLPAQRAPGRAGGCRQPGRGGLG